MSPIMLPKLTISPFLPQFSHCWISQCYNVHGLFQVSTNWLVGNGPSSCRGGKNWKRPIRGTSPDLGGSRKFQNDVPGCHHIIPLQPKIKTWFTVQFVPFQTWPIQTKHTIYDMDIYILYYIIIIYECIYTHYIKWLVSKTPGCFGPSVGVVIKAQSNFATSYCVFYVVPPEFAICQ